MKFLTKFITSIIKQFYKINEKAIFKELQKIYIAKLILKIFNIKKLIKTNINKLNFVIKTSFIYKYNYK